MVVVENESVRPVSIGWEIREPPNLFQHILGLAKKIARCFGWCVKKNDKT